MSRFIDELDRPEKVRPVQVVVIGMSRSGTLALHRALSILGFRSYHMSELIMNGVRDMRILSEAYEASWEGKGTPFSRVEFDKWFGEYNAIVEFPAFFPEEFVAAYPDAKYILTERDPDAWVRSWTATIGVADGHQQIPHRVILRYFDSYLWWTRRTLRGMVSHWTRGKDMTDEGLAHSRQFYIDHIRKVKTIIPPEQLLCLRLEDGLGWEKMCPFLGIPIPDKGWPSKNDPEEFLNGVQFATIPAERRATRRLTLTAGAVAAAVAVGTWYLKIR